MANEARTAQLQARVRLLERRLEVLEAAQRVAQFGCWEWDAATGVVTWSAEMFAICGVDPSTEPSVELYHALVHEDDRERVRRISEEAATTGLSEPHEYRIRRRSDGAVRHVRTSGAALFGADGRPERFVGSLLDLTERKQLVEQFLHSQKLESVGRLAGGVAHDFNNVLTAILGNADLLETVLPGDSPGTRYVEQIRIAGEKAARLTRQLLSFARRQIVEPQVLSPADSIRGTLALVERLMSENIEIHTELDPETWTICIDPGQFEQLLVNLAVNARDAMAGGGRLTVACANVSDAPADGMFEGGDAVRISIGDSGTGVPDEVRPFLFEPFFTTKKRGKGSGLGLSTCHGITSLAGGTIHFEPNEGGGAVFHILLPRSEGEIVEEKARPTAVPRGSGERILLIEDEESVRSMAELVLRRNGYDVRAAATAEEGLEILRAEGSSIALLFSDVVLPGISGPELALRLPEVAPHVRVLFTSGYADETIGSLIQPDTPILTKPYTPAVLLERLREMLGP